VDLRIWGWGMQMRGLGGGGRVGGWVSGDCKGA
jgi:hypothetical protein